MTQQGIGIDELPTVYRQEYEHAIELTRELHDPGTDWDGFAEALWEALVAAFGLDVEVERASDV